MGTEAGVTDVLAGAAQWHVEHGDNRVMLRGLPDGSIDAVVCDPPYELGFMGRAWDASGIAYDVELWREVLRVLRPGGHLIAFGGTRTYHRMTCAIEDAGFEIRDCLAWLYGSGFPKSLDVSKAIDKAAGMEREIVGHRTARLLAGHIDVGSATIPATIPATDAARQWSGWGTALKPAHEPAVLARKPLVGTVAANVQAHGTGALNVDGCRIGTSGGTVASGPPRRTNMVYGEGMGGTPYVAAGGRWPANVLLDEEAAAMLDEQSGVAAPKPRREGRMGGGNGPLNMGRGGDLTGVWPADPGGGASRFFYVAKASTSERERGLGHRDVQRLVQGYASNPDAAPDRAGDIGLNRVKHRANIHPTVKPIALMRHLVRLVTPPGGLVLDPFTGSGTTGISAVLEGFRFIGAELDAEHVAIARDRIAAWQADVTPQAKPTPARKAVRLAAPSVPRDPPTPKRPTVDPRQCSLF